MIECCNISGPSWDKAYDDYPYNKYITPPTIKCYLCGWDTGIATGINMLYIPPPGIKCPICNILVVNVPNITF